MFFNTWGDLLRVIVVGSMGYVALIFFLRVSGKRTLSKMNMFDFVITVALGSTFASLILSKEVALAEGLTALVMLITLQYVVAWLSVRSSRFREIVKGEPTLLFYRGNYLQDSMRAERITGEEVRFAARAQGISAMHEVAAVILETDGTFSVVPDLNADSVSALKDVHVSNRRTPIERSGSADEQPAPG